ncbi:hypothetical protein KIW84_022919 [Lathyrus oleraceus]|uniref:Anion-transporting ATPase-like domain-containing protein n=1 Tax=Pisum sativum TaxID=3888 RepID=A0A9D5B5U1_PEA|nr:hypothetical protein KIW84_022919 [Pisum sativum]
MGSISTLAFPLLVGAGVGVPFSRSSSLRTQHSTSMSVAASSSSSQDVAATQLLTFLGKGGSGKTTAAIFAAQHYAMAGFKTCLVIHSQDVTADYLLNCKIGTSHVLCTNNLSAVRLETTKVRLPFSISSLPRHFHFLLYTLEPFVCFFNNSRCFLNL